MLDMSQDHPSLSVPIHPLTDDQQHYRRLREVEQQRFEEHANYVNQAYQVRRTNERQQFQERMQKCPIGLPPKRLSPRTPPPDFKTPMIPTHSPHRQWSLGEQPTMKKSSPDPNLVISQSNSTIASARDALACQFVPNGHPYRQMNGFGPGFQDPRLQLHQQQQFHAFYAQQFGAQFGMPNGQAQFAQMQYRPPDLLRLQMLQQQQLMQQQQWARQTNVNSTPPPSSVAQQFPPMNRPPQMADPKVADPINPQQINSAQFKQQFWPQQQFVAQNGAQPDGFNVGNPHQLNFIPQAPGHNADSQPKPPSVQSMNGGHQVREEPKLQNENRQKPPQNMTRNEQAQEDDIFGLYSTIGADGVDQDLSKYLDSIPNVGTYNFAQLDNADLRSFLNS